MNSCSSAVSSDSIEPRFLFILWSTTHAGRKVFWGKEILGCVHLRYSTFVHYSLCSCFDFLVTQFLCAVTACKIQKLYKAMRKHSKPSWL